MDEFFAGLRAKGRELLVTFTAIAMLLSFAMGIIGDAILMLLVGAIGWFLSDKEPVKAEAKTKT